jgi:antitoxin FitA
MLSVRDQPDELHRAPRAARLPQHGGQGAPDPAAALSPQGSIKLKLGSLLADMGRKAKLSDHEFALLQQVHDKRLARRELSVETRCGRSTCDGLKPQATLCRLRGRWKGVERADFGPMDGHPTFGPAGHRGCHEDAGTAPRSSSPSRPPRRRSKTAANRARGFAQCQAGSKPSRNHSTHGCLRFTTSPALKRSAPTRLAGRCQARFQWRPN